MKKILMTVPVLALAAGLFVTVLQAANGSVVASPTVPEAASVSSNSAKPDTAAAVASNPTVEMQDWQVTARRPRISYVSAR